MVVVEDADLGGLGRRLAIARHVPAEASRNGRSGPHRIVEIPVDSRAGGGADRGRGGRDASIAMGHRTGEQRFLNLKRRHDQQAMKKHTELYPINGPIDRQEGP